MGATMSVIKTLIVPAVISLLLFILLTYVLIPLWRRYARYSQYLPLDTLSSHTSSLRERITARVAAWRSNRDVAFASDDGSDDGIGDDGEELGNVDEATWRQMEADTRAARPDNARRLSRDLEEGFRDDSDDEPDRLARNNFRS
ncbi:hypothetical protein NXS19_008815 [Fusarium pseudograminearum]|uniref:Uncharacterized protein n=1 Tax=Fusarium pseudograminearum (strain CS3096) TaxID=1028729 RepID=K3VZM1_FUSPC|nr:hypothetical protein FPSE_07277 [Fusarium pseudograminearum CS3096]EKJ72640.1 hypothetical protein FPSE_07277 [Fusarium pseudograminearum CS3096]KAF0636662.1 hypothetical protein FPSE5266_07277 [Fusarium pseudograminearum]QPC78559.1 hypothetical protein HYE68_009311 [Fusarium pseudograminearum]UZP40999.1 hypothetical protein NXS19_008815 [Fusarium pseudograminearum]